MSLPPFLAAAASAVFRRAAQTASSRRAQALASSAAESRSRTALMHGSDDADAVAGKAIGLLRRVDAAGDGLAVLRGRRRRREAGAGRAEAEQDREHACGAH